MTGPQATPDYGAWVGRERHDRDVLTPRLAESYDATLDRPARTYAVGDAAPLAIHWMLCQPRAPHHLLGSDGHPLRGDFLPPIELPRRMWAGSRVEFLAPLRVGDVVDLTSKIASVTAKHGSTGPLIFVEVDHSITVAQQPRLRERQTIVYREPPSGQDSQKDSANTAGPRPAAPAETWSRRRSFTPDTPLLFRYSALTFNGHRIHYDQDYARGVEGYPNLVVHAPLTATSLLLLFEDQIAAKPIIFSFRGVRPLFAGRPIDLCGRNEGDRFVLEAHDNQQSVAMTAEIAPSSGSV